MKLRGKATEKSILSALRKIEAKECHRAEKKQKTECTEGEEGVIELAGSDNDDMSDDDIGGDDDDVAKHCQVEDGDIVDGSGPEDRDAGDGKLAPNYDIPQRLTKIPLKIQMAKRISVSHAGSLVRVCVRPATNEAALLRMLGMELGIPSETIAALQDSEGCAIPIDYGSLENEDTYSVRLAPGNWTCSSPGGSAAPGTPYGSAPISPQAPASRNASGFCSPDNSWIAQPAPRMPQEFARQTPPGSHRQCERSRTPSRRPPPLEVFSKPLASLESNNSRHGATRNTLVL